ncbi:DNA replication licensing factor MCM7 [Beauveria bassiana]|uniref:DNA replication licensing factor MCM7 n=1 Tax=Beauveria bassiana TaxID=176275 RepID=A0A2N6NLZ5_BEABA|nr:DNA replication licensing factor MCM7 [Beauveria bassiana]
MALREYKAIVNYETHQTLKDAFEVFLKDFKTTPEHTITTAMGNITIDEDDLSDEYDFMDDDDESGERRRRDREHRRAPHHKYQEIMQKLANRTQEEIVIDLDDLAAWENETGEGLKLVDSIELNTKHYVDIMSQAVDKVMPLPSSDVNFKDDVLDVLMARRQARNRELEEAAERDPTLEEDKFPAELTRRYTLVFKPRVNGPDFASKALAVRHVRGDNLGHLITVRAIVTRVSDVKPIVQVSAYTCDRCGCEIFQPVTDRQYGPLMMCPSADCKNNQSKGQLNPSTRASKFLPFQEVKVQEMAEQVPIGQIPRSLTIHCYGSLVRRVNPGDVVDISGIFLPTPYTGFKAMKAGLLTDTYLEAHHIRQHKKAYSEMIVDPSLTDWSSI